MDPVFIAVVLGVLVAFISFSILISISQIGKPREPTTAGAVNAAIVVWILFFGFGVIPAIITLVNL